MAELQLYKLHFTTPVHFGNNREDYGISLKTLQSDTLYSALMSCLAKVGYNIPADGDLGFVTSSLFPFYQKEQDTKTVYFIPKPLKQLLPKLNDVKEIKRVKKVSWIDLDYFQKVLNGKPLYETENDVKNIQGEFLTATEIKEDFISSQVMSRVTVSRTSQEDAKPFYMDRVYFKYYSGLYFIAQCNDCVLLEKALNVLKDEGLGTDRNVGNGFFEWSKESVNLQFCESDYSMALSSFIPESREQLESFIDGDNVAYDFIHRGGWITTPPYNTLRKNYIYAFLPGSVFKLTVNSPQIHGAIKDLTPELPDEMNHHIWRSGKAIFIPIKI